MAREIWLPCDSQPQDNARLSAYASAIGCELVLLPHGGAVDVSGKLSRVTGAGTPTTGVGTKGVRREYSSAADYWNLQGAINPTRGYWWLIVGNFSSVGTWSGLVARNTNDGTTSGWGWQRNISLDALRVSHGADSATLGTLNDLLGTEEAVWLGTWSPTDNNAALFRNGEMVRSVTLSTAPNYTSGTGQLRLFSSRDVSLSSGGWSLAAFGSPGLLDDSACRELSYRAYELLESRMWLPVSAAGGAPTLSDLQAVSVTSSSVQATYDYAF